MLNKIKLSFIVVNYQSERYLKKCLASLFNKVKNIDFEIIIVNNNKNDLMGIKNAKIINLKRNMGFGKANNIGAKKASGDFLCFLNPDTLLISENIKQIIEEFENNREIGAIGPRVLNKFNKAQIWSAGTEANLWDLIKNNLGIKKSRQIWESETKKEAGWVTGAALFLPRQLFLKLKGFDEKFFLYFEDVDLCKRIRRLGKKIIYFPEIKIKHWGGKSSPNKSEQKKEYYKSQDYYFKKHYGKTISWIVKILRGMIYYK